MVICKYLIYFSLFFIGAGSLSESFTTVKSDLKLFSESNLEETVKFLVSFPDRYAKSPEPNTHIQPFIKKIEQVTADSDLDIQIINFTHKKTKQNSILVQFTPDEKNISLDSRPLIILMAHIDSRVIRPNRKIAPGADDNASGCANLLEVIRVLALQKKINTQVEFHFYASEEVRKLGSSEISKLYKRNNKRVIAALNLDMTAFAGSGVGHMTLLTKFTDDSLNERLLAINSELGIFKSILLEDPKREMSDHANWFKRGYPVAAAYESHLKDGNKKIHTINDTIESLNFKHSILFSQLAYALVMSYQ